MWLYYPTLSLLNTFIVLTMKMKPFLGLLCCLLLFFFSAFKNDMTEISFQVQTFCKFTSLMVVCKLLVQ